MKKNHEQERREFDRRAETIQKSVAGLPGDALILVNGAGIAYGDVELDVAVPVTQRTILDALEAKYPMLRGTTRDQVTHKRRPFMLFFACGLDLSDDPPDAAVPEAVARGARVLTGGEREGRFIRPAVVTNVPRDARLVREEVFGPVVVVETYDRFEDAVARIEDSRYGLQAGVFTHDVRRIFYAFEHLTVGGVIVNDNPMFRVDNFPYGGVKDSGLGREGVKYAMEAMTEPRILIFDASH